MKGISVSKSKDLNVSPLGMCTGFGQDIKTKHVHRPLGKTQRLHYKLKSGLVTGTYEKQPVGIVRIAKDLQTNMIYHRVYQILKKNSVVTASTTKSKKRKWARYE